MKTGHVIQTIGDFTFSIARGTNSRGELRRDWFLKISRPRREPTFFTGFDSPERVVEYARTFKAPTKRGKS